MRQLQRYVRPKSAPTQSASSRRDSPRFYSRFFFGWVGFESDVEVGEVHVNYAGVEDFFVEEEGDGEVVDGDGVGAGGAFEESAVGFGGGWGGRGRGGFRQLAELTPQPADRRYLTNWGFLSVLWYFFGAVVWSIKGYKARNAGAGAASSREDPQKYAQYKIPPFTPPLTPAPPPPPPAGTRSRRSASSRRPPPAESALPSATT